MILVFSLALMAAQDVPMPIVAGDLRYNEAAIEVRKWITQLDDKAMGEPTQLLICDWRPGKRTALVKIRRAGSFVNYPSQSFYSESSGALVRTAYDHEGKAIAPVDQPIVDAALKLCAPQLTQ